MKERAPVIAAGGIVVRNSERPLIAIVRLAKEKAWVLPKGKLKPGESPLDAAKREVEEETGHAVTVLGFLGSMSQIDDRKHKIVQFWHMRAGSAPVRPLMRDIKAVKWLPLRQAIDKLTRPHEKAFLSHAGPAALQAAAQGQQNGDTGALPNDTIFGTIRAWLRRMGKPAIQG